MEVGGLLSVELTVHSTAVLCGTEPLEAIVDQLCVLFVEVFMSHDIRRAGVHLVAAHLMEMGEIKKVLSLEVVQRRTKCSKQCGFQKVSGEEN